MILNILLIISFLFFLFFMWVVRSYSIKQDEDSKKRMELLKRVQDLQQRINKPGNKRIL